MFATRTGRAISQRNTLRELRRAMTAARTTDGAPTFPALFEHDARGELAVEIDQPFRAGASVARGRCRRSTASGTPPRPSRSPTATWRRSSWQLGHKSSVVTRSVYRHEVKNAERTAHRRATMERPLRRRSARRPTAVAGEAPAGEVIDLGQRRAGA